MSLKPNPFGPFLSSWLGGDLLAPAILFGGRQAPRVGDPENTRPKGVITRPPILIRTGISIPTDGQP
ncbi:hypothetical protein N7516_007984 [Penicillium verrucosum]|uniref:uncharacterized protein n=1 Tax=Penicillium verrucosum TaxID=60171 RepID=UPI002544E436|nr:uncharacterized protein N7516_007984 [Penicillium verrucosum]KAJ5926211.1 hypothetical protein N7516_007984 [Penicillium verrucosum]